MAFFRSVVVLEGEVVEEEEANWPKWTREGNKDSANWVSNDLDFVHEVGAIVVT